MADFRMRTIVITGDYARCHLTTGMRRVNQSLLVNNTGKSFLELKYSLLNIL